MCISLIENSSAVHTSDVNKITEDLNDKFADLDSFHEFANKCYYINEISELETNKKDLLVMHLNICSIIPRQQDLLKLLVNNNIDLCTVSETWLNDQNTSLLKLPNYIIEHTPRSNKRGGGVGIILIKTLKYKQHNDIEQKIKSLELCVLQIDGLNSDLLVVSLYHPPNSDKQKFMNEYKY